MSINFSFADDSILDPALNFFHCESRQLYKQMNQIANTLRSYGVKKGDRVAIYLPCCTIAAASMLACARIGAVHSVVFAGFSAESLASRINDCN